MKEYRITRSNQIKNIWPLLFYLFLLGGIVLFLIFKEGDISIALFVFFGIAFLTQLIPQVALHWNYYSINKDDIISYDNIKQEVILFHHNDEIKFCLDNIKEVIMFKSYASEKGTWEFLTFDSYYHAIIMLHDGTKIIVTSLLMPDFNLPIEKEKITLELHIYRWATGPSVQKPTHARN